jgi:hypothetical protein
VDFPSLSFKLSLGHLCRPHHVNPGGVQKTTPQVPLYKPHTVQESSWPFYLIHLLPHSLSHVWSKSEHTTSSCGNWHLVFLKNNWNKYWNKWTIHRRKKHRSREWPTCWVTYGVYSGKRLNSVSVRSAERVLTLTYFISVYICQVPNLINYQLQTLGYQQLVDKNRIWRILLLIPSLTPPPRINSWLITQNSLLIT